MYSCQNKRNGLRISTFNSRNKNYGKFSRCKFLKSAEKIVNGNIRKQLNINDLKVNIVVFAECQKDEEPQEMNFKSQDEIITSACNLGDFYSKILNKILSEMEECEIRGSQWRLKRILRIELRINKYNPLRGASYNSLPKVLANEKSIINVQNEDNRCFLWSILSALHPADKNSYRVCKYKKWENEFDKALCGI